MTKNNVTVIGLGLMGSALARVLSTDDFNVTVWNRSPDKAQLFESGAVVIADTIVEAIQASDIIVVCIRDYEVTAELLRTSSVESELADKVIIQLSTGTPAKAREASTWAAGVGAAYLDGEIMAFPDAIGTDSCTILYAGNTESFEACRPVIDAFGGTAQLLGDDPGVAPALSNALLSIYFGFVFGALNGAAICDAEKVPLPLFRELGVSLLPVFGDVISRSVEMISTDSYESQHSNLATSEGALAQIAAVGQDAGLDGRFIECMRMYAAEGVEDGLKDSGNAILFKKFRRVLESA